MAKHQKNIIHELADNGEDFEVSGIGQNKSALVEFYKYIQEHFDSIPWRQMEKMGWIQGGKNVESLAPLADAFLEDNKKTLLFRKAKTANDYLVSFWVSKIESEAKKVFFKDPSISFDRGNFTEEALYGISRMSPDPSSVRALPALLKGYGIILIYERGLSGIKSDGVVTKLVNGLPVVGMTLRYSRLDNFWFTLMHELSHVFLHYDEIGTPIIEDLQLESHELLEKQANKYAQNILIPRRDWYRCPPRYERTNESIIKFASKLSIHPSIVAGRLQKEIDRFDLFRDIVDSTNVSELIWG